MKITRMSLEDELAEIREIAKDNPELAQELLNEVKEYLESNPEESTLLN